MTAQAKCCTTCGAEGPEAKGGQRLMQPPLTISKVRYGFDVHCGENKASGLGFDEAAWEVAEYFLRDRTPPQIDGTTEDVEWTLTVECHDGWWCVSSPDGRFRSMLAVQEAFGFVLKYMATGEGMFGGLRTYEQELAEWPEVYRRKPVANLVHA